MIVSKFFSIFQRLFRNKTMSTDFKPTSSGTYFKELYGSDMGDRKVVLVTARNYTVPSGVPGSGAGKGGGSGGSVRESGGGLGRYGAAQEEGYFFKKQKEQLAKIKKKLKQDLQDDGAPRPKE